MREPSGLGSKGPAAQGTALALGSLFNGLGAYLYLTLGTRAYGAEAFAPVSVLWSFWAISAAVLTFPIQHWAIRRITLDGHDGGLRRALGRLGGVVLVTGSALGVSSYLLRGRLFADTTLFWPAVVAGITVGAGFSGYARGLLVGHRKYYLVSALVAAESLLRLVAGAVAAVLHATVTWFGAALIVGSLMAAFIPRVYRLDRRPGGRGPVVAFIGGTAGGFSLSQILLNAGPVALSLLGGEPSRVTGMFAAMALFRAPHLIALGAASRLTGPLTRLTVQERWGQLRRVVRALIAGGGLAAAGASALGYWFGAWLITAVFGIEAALSGPQLACVAAGSALAVASLLVTLVAVAGGDTGAVAVCWGLGCAVAAALLWLWPGSAATTVVVAFLGAEAVAFCCLSGVQLSRLRGRR